MRFASLGSGSRGNATLVEADDTLVLVDCGFSVKELDRRVQRLGRQAEELDAILVTHEHGDHIAGVGALARKLNIPVYLSAGTLVAARDLDGVATRVVSSHRGFDVGALRVEPVAVPHDAREPCQYVLNQDGRRLGVLTDLGSLTSHVLDCYRRCDALLLECNHDRDMLLQGPYPWPLKQRVGGDWGHLSNEQSAQLLSALDTECLQHLVVAHVSEQNNTGKMALAAVEPQVKANTSVALADQDSGLDWRRIA